MGVMIVTGGSRGIGAAIARLAGRRGYKVAVNYRQAKDRADAVVGEIRAGGGTAVAVAGDVGRPDDVRALFAATDAALGPVTALINNAGIGISKPVAATMPEETAAQFATNVLGLIGCCGEAVGRMSTARGGQGGVIVNIGSAAARHGGLPNDCVYTATKGAVDAFTLALSKEVARQGIRVCCVRPGLTETEIFGDAAARAEIVERAKQLVPSAASASPRRWPPSCSGCARPRPPTSPASATTSPEDDDAPRPAADRTSIAHDERTERTRWLACTT